MTTESNNKNKQSIQTADIDLALDMLNQHLNPEDISPLLSALTTLKTNPNSEDYKTQVVTAFNELGHLQGAVLTFAPYLNIFVSDDPFDISR